MESDKFIEEYYFPDLDLLEGREGFEPPTSASEAQRSIQLKLAAHKSILQY